MTDCLRSLLIASTLGTKATLVTCQNMSDVTRYGCEPAGEGGFVVKNASQYPTHAIPAESTNAVTAVGARVTGLPS